MSVNFSPDGRRIITGSQDQTAKVWDAATGNELLTFKDHKEWIRSRPEIGLQDEERKEGSGSIDSV
jgi:WD40 repeat protein